MRWVPRLGVALTIVLQILWPLADGPTRTTLTISTVLVFTTTTLSHAWIHRGGLWALAYAGITMLFAFTLEAIGVATGIPFSPYSYSDALGLKLLDVPLLIPLAWTMMAYPALLLARTLTASAHRLITPLTAVTGAWALTSWDLFLDPQMVTAGYWTWVNPTPNLLGVSDIPAVNFLGWLFATFALMLLLYKLPTDRPPSNQGVPASLWTWTWIGGVVANAFFFGRPAVAAWGGICMGLVTIPYLLALKRRESA